MLRPSQGVCGTGDQGQFFQGNKCLKIRGTEEHRRFWRTGNIENQDFLGEQGHFSRGTREGLCVVVCIFYPNDSMARVKKGKRKEDVHIIETDGVVYAVFCIFLLGSPPNGSMASVKLIVKLKLPVGIEILLIFACASNYLG